MLLRTIADNYGEIVFSNRPSPALEYIQIPGARYYSASGSFGELLFQEIRGNLFSVWQRSFLINRYAVFTCMHTQPCLKLMFQLQNSIQYHSAALGDLEYHERGYNLCYSPLVHNKIYFRNTGLYTSLEIYFNSNTLQPLGVLYPLLTDFMANIQKQQAVLLMRVNQVATQKVVREIADMLRVDNITSLPPHSIDDRCMSILKNCLEKVSLEPRLKPIRLSYKEIEQVYHARKMLEKNMHIPFYLDTLSEITPLSPYRLKKGFKQVYDLSPADYLRNIRMEKALTLLKEKGFSIHDVAIQTGYGNSNSFSHAFKKYHYVSPVIFLKDHTG